MLADVTEETIHRVTNGHEPSKELLNTVSMFQTAWNRLHSGAIPDEYVIIAAVMCDAVDAAQDQPVTKWTNLDAGTALHIKDVGGGGAYAATFVKELGGSRFGQLEILAFGDSSCKKVVLAENCQIRSEMPALPVPMVPENQEPVNKAEEFASVVPDDVMQEDAEPEELDDDEPLELTAGDATLDTCIAGDIVSVLDDKGEVRTGEFVGLINDMVSVAIDGESQSFERAKVVVT